MEEKPLRHPEGGKTVGAGVWSRITE